MTEVLKKQDKKKSKRKQRKPVSIAPPKIKSRRRARQLTTSFHRLTHELDSIKQDKDLSTEEKKAKENEIQEQLDDMGGRVAYQDASILSTSLHKTSKWVFQLLTKLDLRPKSKQPPLRVLEVGAINTQLVVCPWMNVRAIDLISRNERIEQIDFFNLVPNQSYQVVVSSMVINCVPDASKRGEMLQLYHSHLESDGLLFLMLPLLCLSNSTFMTYARFVDILKAVGFQIVETKNSPKVAFFCLRKATPKSNTSGTFPQVKVRQGHKRNAFSVIL